MAARPGHRRLSTLSSGQGPPGAEVAEVTTDDVPHDAVDTKSFTIKAKGGMSENSHGPRRDIPDFPKPGILFKRYHPAPPGSGGRCYEAILGASQPLRGLGVTKVAAIDRADYPRSAGRDGPQARVGRSSASRANCPRNATAWNTTWSTGQDALEIHADSFAAG